MISSEFGKQDYWLIKWPLISILVSIVLVTGLLVGLNAVSSEATAQLNRARSELSAAQQSVAEIEQEEATIVEYIGRYREIADEGVVAAEDRLQFQETVGELRMRYNLNPVDIIIDEQRALPLQYPDGDPGDGRQVLLNASLVEFTLPLLHEGDLARLLAALLEGPGLLQPLTCSLSANGATTNFVYLADHFSAACSLHWYTFQLPPADTEAE